MAADPLRAAIIGCGAIATQHLEFLAATPQATLVGVCDLSPATAGYTPRRYATEPFTDASAMLATARPDVVHVLTPPSSHRPLVELALQHDLGDGWGVSASALRGWRSARVDGFDYRRRVLRLTVGWSG